MNNEIFLWPKIFCVIVFTDWCKSQKDSFIAEVFGVTLTQDTCAVFFFFLPKEWKTELRTSLVVFLWFGFLLWMYVYLCTRKLLHKMCLDESNYKIRFNLFFKLLMWHLVLSRWRCKLTGCCCCCKSGSIVWS